MLGALEMVLPSLSTRGPFPGPSAAARSQQAEKRVWLGFQMQEGCRSPLHPQGEETERQP